MALTRDEKLKIISKFSREKGDTGSPEVQIALLSLKIDRLAKHLKQHKNEISMEREGEKLTLSTGSRANQAGGAVMASYGETVVLATVVAAKPREDLDYFPLSVDYPARLYTAG